MANENLLTLTADIVSAHVENNKVATSDLPAAISAVYNALAGLSQAAEPVAEPQSPAVSIRASVKPDAITCLFCGKRQKTLKRHLMTTHGIEPSDYRTIWDLPASYPMVAPNYAAQRSEMAKRIGLGRKPGAKVTAKRKTPAKR